MMSLKFGLPAQFKERKSGGQAILLFSKEMNMTPKVFLYALSTCSHCKRTKQFFKDNGIDFDFLDVDLSQGEKRESAIDAVKKHNPRLTFPTTLIGDKVIVGFKEKEIREALGL